MAMGSRNGNRVPGEENKEVMQQDLVHDQVRQEASALVKRVAEGYSALQNLMEQNPWLADEMDAEDRERKRAVDNKLRKGLEKANDAPRCRWVSQGGTSCGSPQMRNHIYCYAHRQMMEARALALRLPALEDANAIQIGLMRIQKALVDDTISVKKAGLLLYSMQLAITNVGKTTFGQANDEELVMELVDEEQALMDEKRPEPVEWKPSAEMLRNKNLAEKSPDHADVSESGERIAPKTERDRSWVELPVSVLKTDMVSGSFDAPSLAPRAPACSG
jgi:hypothetical protein